MQFVVVTTGVAIARAFIYKYGVTPQFCAGHSVGEYAALVCSGAIKFSDAIKIIKVRGELLKKAVANKVGQMSIIEKMKIDVAENILRENKDLQVYISCYNSPDQFAISGLHVEQVEEELLKENARVTPVMFSPPIHCPLMNEYSKELYDYLSNLTFHSFRMPIVCNITGAPFSNPSMIPYVMSEQLIKPVQWSNTMSCFEKYGVSMIIEMGPKSLLTSLSKNTNPDIKRYCYGIKNERSEINDIFISDESLQRDKVNFIDRCLGIAVSTQNQNDNPEQYQSGVVDNYNHIKMLSNQVQANGCPAAADDMRQAIQCLIKIMQTKKVPEQEQQDWLKQLLDETSTYYNLKEFVN